MGHAAGRGPGPGRGGRRGRGDGVSARLVARGATGQLFTALDGAMIWGLELAGVGFAMNVGDGTSSGLAVGGRLVRAYPGGLELTAGLDGALIPSLRFDGGDQYSERLGAAGPAARCGQHRQPRPRPGQLRAGGRGRRAAVRQPDHADSDGGGATTVTHASDTDVGPALSLTLGAGSRRRGGYYGVEQGLGVGFAAEVGTV